MKKRILKLAIITHDLDIGGLQQVVVNIGKEVDRTIFEPSIICLRNLGPFAEEAKKSGVKVTLVKKKAGGTDYFTFLKIAKILKEDKIDIIHTHNTQPFVEGTLAAILSGVKTIVHTDHARAFPDKKRYMFAEWLASHFATKIVGVSDHTSDNLIKYEKINEKKIVTILNGIDEAKYVVDVDVRRKRKELGINPSGPVIGLGVRLRSQKGISYLLDAMPGIVENVPDISLVIAGEGALERELKEKTANLKMGKNVFFIGPRNDIPELLKLFDIYVLPSLWEGLPMVLLEAMAAKCPIIATDVGGNHIAVRHMVNGLLIPPRDTVKLKETILWMLENPGKRKEFSDTGYTLFKKNFSSGIMTREYERLYLQKING